MWVKQCHKQNPIVDIVDIVDGEVPPIKIVILGMVYYCFNYNIYICVCVYHLNRCKTSHWFFTNLQGDGEDI